MPSANTDTSLPLPRPDQVYVTVSALDGGHLTLPEHLFVTDADPNRRVTVPSLSFLIQHPSRGSETPTRLLFDLGMKRNQEQFPPLMQTHIRNRQPTILYPDVGDSLRAGGLDPAEIEMVILSHVRTFPGFHSKKSSDKSATRCIGIMSVHRQTSVKPNS